MTELKPVLRNVGKGIGFDGIPPAICKLFPQSLCTHLLNILDQVFSGSYPSSWMKQLLFPIEKKGHTLSTPKLRGIALSSVLPRIYDTIIDNRFSNWYTPNKEQSGFREGQGCTLQQLFLSLMVELAKESHADLYILLIDYEKAFDYANRAIILKDMMEEGAGDTFLRAIASMYQESTYIPKIDRSMLGDPISTFYGVTQGRRSSTNFFSYLIRGMADAVHTNEYEDFMEEEDLAQMADDTMAAAEFRSSLGDKFESIHDYSIARGQSINIDKTLFIHMSKTPDTETIMCKNDTINISSLEIGKSSPYLGFHLKHTDSLEELVKYNLNTRMYNIAKFKSWLDVNENTPFSVKLLVLDNCVLSSIVNGFEAWGNLQPFAECLQTTELRLLRMILGVKIGTPSNIMYQELGRGSLVSLLMDRQHSFIQNIIAFNEDDAIVKVLWNKCQNIDIYKYYLSLSNDNYVKDIANRAEFLSDSQKTQDKRYTDLIGLNEPNCIYDSYASDSCRMIITRWRLSNYSLAVETGRYVFPKVERINRLCKTCLIMEDEEHVFFSCPLYNQLRSDHPEFFRKSVKDMLNPLSKDALYETANILKKVEKIHTKFNNR